MKRQIFSVSGAVRTVSGATKLRHFGLFSLNGNTTNTNALVLVVVVLNSSYVTPAREVAEFVYLRVTRHKNSSGLPIFKFHLNEKVTSCVKNVSKV